MPSIPVFLIALSTLFILGVFLVRALRQQERTLERGLTRLRADWEQSQEAKAGRIRSELSQALHHNRVEMHQGLARVEEHLKQAEAQLAHLNTVGRSIHDLNNVMKLPHLRGQLGEATLERLLSDYLPAGSFE